MDLNALQLLLLQYLAWRVLTGLHRTVTMSFMLVGHTKFAPDWCFGLFKQRFRRTFVSSLDDVVDVVNTSADVNVAQLVGSQSGEPIVPVYNWVTYLGSHFRSIPHLKKYHHFTFSATHPGVVMLKEYSNTSEETFTMLDSGSWSPVASELPSHRAQRSPSRKAMVSVPTDTKLLSRRHRRPHLSQTLSLTQHHKHHKHHN